MAASKDTLSGSEPTVKPDLYSAPLGFCDVSGASLHVDKTLPIHTCEATTHC